MNLYGNGVRNDPARKSCCSARFLQQGAMGTLHGVVMFALISVLLVASAVIAGAQTYSVLYSFAGPPDGAEPETPVTLDATTGNLYGTTSFGGSGGCDCGTVFELTPTGVETVLHSFAGAPDDGAQPYDVFLDAKGHLFGTTQSGGPYGGGAGGIVFKIDSKGVEKVLYSFENGNDGARPSSGLIQDAMTGDFYGVTFGGGAYDHGTLYTITPTGKKTILHSFGGAGDGFYPVENLAQDATTGNLYGTLYANAGPENWCGGVFEMTPAGVETMLYFFTGLKGDGCLPTTDDPGLVRDAQGNLFGTTLLGGIASQGVVFELTAGGIEKVLYRFKGVRKGYAAASRAGLVLDESTGNLYGTTGGGGAYNSGTIFKLSPPKTKHGRWSQSTLYTFTGGADGLNPFAGLVRDAQTGNLYGTTEFGGTYGYGVVFKLTP